MRRTALPLAFRLAPPAGAMLPDDDIDPALIPLRDRIEAGEAAAVLPGLRGLPEGRPKDADVLTLIAFALRHLGDTDAARAHYDRALAIDPGHPGALEYLGEMEFGLGNVAAAKAIEERLTAACPFGCGALGDLRAALRAAGH